MYVAYLPLDPSEQAWQYDRGLKRLVSVVVVAISTCFGFSPHFPLIAVSIFSLQLRAIMVQPANPLNIFFRFPAFCLLITIPLPYRRPIDIR